MNNNTKPTFRGLFGRAIKAGYKAFDTADNLLDATNDLSRAAKYMASGALAYSRNFAATCKATADAELQDDLTAAFVDSEINRLEAIAKVNKALSDAKVTDEDATKIVEDAQSKAKTTLASLPVDLD